MAGQVVERMEEREESLYFQEHLARYQFALTRFVPGRVLDIATGTGYGADLIAKAGYETIGADVDLPSLETARDRYHHTGLTFVHADGLHLPYPDGHFANVVTLETLEHIADDRGYVRELARVLTCDGICILSTPDRTHSERHRRVNPYHVREYAEEGLRALLAERFREVEIYYQGFAASYWDRVRGHAATIQASKRQMNPLLRFGVERIYRPFKARVPARLTNATIRSLAGTAYPQPTAEEIAITNERLEDSNVFVAVLRGPQRS